MGQHDEKYLAELRRHAAETRTLFSNSQKPERERMVVRSFLRCIGESFTDGEILANQPEPVDIAFRGARFQVMDIVGDRKRGRDRRERERRYEKAKSVSDVTEPWTDSIPMSFDEVSRAVAEGLTDKASHYGVKNCSGLDVLVYVDLKGRHLWPLEPALDAEVARILEEQGWLSASMLLVPYGAVLIAQADAPSFLREKPGRILNEWPHCDGWFDAEPLATAPNHPPSE